MIGLGAGRPRSLWWSFGIAILAVAIAAAVRMIVLAGLGSHVAYHTFYSAVTIVALVGGLLASAVASVLSALTVVFWISPPSDVSDWLAVGIFFISCSLIIGVTEAMRRAIGRLQAALAQQRRFSANAAHQLRTPLAILRTRIDGLPPTTAQAELLGDVDRMTRLVSQLLIATRLEAGQMENFEVVDLTEFVRKILAEIAPLAHAADRDLELDSPGKVPAMVSTSALEEAIRNLVDNALRHTPPGSTVSVSVRPGATIEVRDRGPGVPLELREQVFEPFWSAACKSQGSAGLGLAIVREALQLHGGSVEIADAAGGGAIFRLVLPQDLVRLRGGGLAPVNEARRGGDDDRSWTCTHRGIVTSPLGLPSVTFSRNH